jgi:hypothetical protein
MMMVVTAVSLFLAEVTLVAGLTRPQLLPQPTPAISKIDSQRRRAFLSGIINSSSTVFVTTVASGYLWSAAAQPVHAAYEARVIGGENPSATMAAFNLQIQQTTARLEKDGFPP